MRKFFKFLHRWLSLPLGLFISIMCFTGALLLWRNEISALCGEDSSIASFFRGVTQLHRWLFDVPANPRGGLSVGRVIMGVSAMACTLIVLSGIVLWWPKSVKMLRSRLRLSFSRGWRRFVYDSHVSLGVYASVFLLLMSLTGPVWSFGWYRKAAVAVIGGQEAPRVPYPPHTGGGQVGKPVAHRKPMGAESSSTYGHGAKGDASKPHRPYGFQRPAAGRGEAGEVTQRSKRPMNAVQEGIKGRGEGKRSPQRTFISLHTGKWGGLLTKIIYTLVALIGGFLPVSGYYLWWKQRRRR